jgi:heme-degrading monooxygenase HmoA
MIERHVTFNVLPGQEQAFERLFVEEYRPATSRVPGFVKAELLREQEDPNQYQMVIRFESLETAANSRNSDQHQSPEVWERRQRSGPAEAPGSEPPMFSCQTCFLLLSLFAWVYTPKLDVSALTTTTLNSTVPNLASNRTSFLHTFRRF